MRGIGFNSITALNDAVFDHRVITNINVIHDHGVLNDTVVADIHFLEENGTLDCSAVAIGFASSTFIGQNYGAKRLDRVHEGIRKATWIALGVGAAITALILIFERPVVNLFLDRSVENAAEALDVACGYITVMALMLVGAYLMNLYRYSLQGLGNTTAPMLSGFFEFGARIFVAYVFPVFLGSSGLFFMDGSAWWAAGIFQILCFYRTLKKIDRSGTL